MKNGLLILCFICFNSYNYAQNFQTSSITFSGLTKTKESYLRKIIKTKEGQVFDSIQLSKDIELLKNLNLFFDVSAETKKVKESILVSINIKEAFYVYPIVSLSGFKNQLKLRAGVNFINFMGRAQNFGFIYQYYGRHSFILFHSQKRHSNGSTGHDFSVSRTGTIEPLYQNDSVSFFNFDNNAVSLGGHTWFNNQLKFGMGGQFMTEKYEQLDQGFYLGQPVFHFKKIQIRSNIEYNTLQNYFEFVEGTKCQLYVESIFTEGHPDASFTKLTIEASKYLKVGDHGDFASNARFGIATNNMSPFSPFVLDGILNVRGIGNRIERGTAELITNIEYRHSFYSNKTFSIQGAVFADYGTTRMPGTTISTFFNRDDHYLFTGVGVRLHLRKWFKTCFRIDYSVNSLNSKQQGFTFGFGQFF